MVSVVLVGPEQAANVGFAARTLACYGLSDLRIVGSPGIAADGAARKTGKAAPSVLDGVAYYPSLEAALGDRTSAHGFTRRVRDPAQRIDDLPQAAAAFRTHPDSAPALVFGRESQGLFREETLLLTHLVRIPMPAETLSLNLSHAIAIGLYAFLGEVAGEQQSVAKPASADSVVTPRDAAVGSADADISASAQGGEATRAEDAAAFQMLISRLDAGGFFKGGKDEAQREHVRLLWQRLRPDRRELDFLAGILKNLAPRAR